MLKDRSVLKYCFIELFAGCGGGVLCFMNAGWKCLAAVEWAEDAVWSMWYNLAMEGFSNLKVSPDKFDGMKRRIGDRAETHNRIFTHIPEDDWLSRDDHVSPVLNIYCMDIMKMEPEDLLKDLELEPGELGAISGGPPCQGFSVAGERNFDDPRNQLPFRYMHFIKVIKPIMFHMENVPGMLTLGRKKGEIEGPYMQWLRTAADEAGYVFDYKILNACNYGVPQSRKRVMILGIRKDVYNSGKQHSWPEPTHTWLFHDALKNGIIKEMLSTGKQPFVNVREAFGDLNPWKLSACMDKNCIHLPDGHPDRRGHGNKGKHKDANRDDITSELREDNHIWYKDRFSGNWFKGNHRAEGNDTDFEHYKSCRFCCKLNLVVRETCHYCKGPQHPIPNFDYLTI